MTTIAALFLATTVQLHLPSGLLSSLCFVESRHNPAAVHHDDGRGDSLGVCQIKLETARFLGFKGSRVELMRPGINIRYAGLYLNRQIHRYDGNIYRGVSAYNTGTFRPKSITYVTRVFKQWAHR